MPIKRPLRAGSCPLNAPSGASRRNAKTSRPDPGRYLLMGAHSQSGTPIGRARPAAHLLMDAHFKSARDPGTGPSPGQNLMSQIESGPRGVGSEMCVELRQIPESRSAAMQSYVKASEKWSTPVRT